MNPDNIERKLEELERQNARGQTLQFFFFVLIMVGLGVSAYRTTNIQAILERPQPTTTK